LSSTMQSLVVALVMLWKRDIRRNSSEVSLISVIFTASLYGGGIIQKIMETATTNHNSIYISQVPFVLVVLFF
jgi:hypothetical protein